MKDWEETHPVSIEKAQEKIERFFPELKPISIEHAGTGFDTTVYRVNKELVFRFPRQEKGLHAMENENKVLTYLQKNFFSSPYEVPAPLFYGQQEGEDFPFVGFSFVSGKELAEEHDVNLLSKEVNNLAAFLSSLHQLPAAEMSLIPDELKRLSSQKRKPMLEEIFTEIASICDKSTIDMAHFYLKEIPEWENPESTHFVHGDLHPKNIIAAENRISGIIDWGDAHFGHPASDLALLYQAVPQEFHRNFFDIYGPINEETRKLAIFKAVFLSAAVGRYAMYKGETHVIRWCHAGLKRSLETWFKD
ncbi:phosphotransferase family protein [Alkalicoccus daliensis]|uniref:Phosphotransferase enzyme family protein n=1 Tax=Alkalicoccus daliensis TaxID=745820 RepID=A0A1H0FYC4_9BACI|nr:phosphotransferase [Alkalicoccus daliensis]SDN99564.1 Phosphotransferase enzyme family protein [Alkalicoccus daliensis]